MRTLNDIFYTMKLFIFTIVILAGTVFGIISILLFAILGKAIFGVYVALAFIFVCALFGYGAFKRITVLEAQFNNLYEEDEE